MFTIEKMILAAHAYEQET